MFFLSYNYTNNKYNIEKNIFLKLSKNFILRNFLSKTEEMFFNSNSIFNSKKRFLLKILKNYFF